MLNTVARAGGCGQCCPNIVRGRSNPNLGSGQQQILTSASRYRLPSSHSACGNSLGWCSTTLAAMVRDLSSDKEAQGGVETLCVKSYEEVGFEFVGKAG